MSQKLDMPKLVDAKPRLTVIGIGGAGCNAVNNMIAAGLQGVDFVVANTDAQSLQASSAEHRIQLGASLTEGLGAGSKPEIGEAAAEETIDELRQRIAGSHMVFIAAGMGGGTGTGAAAVVARVAREMGALTVGIVTKPFQFEGTRRMRTAEAGIQALRQNVDTLIVIPNQNLFRVANERTTFAEAFVLADQVLYSGVACIVDLVLKEGLINLDFADVRTVMSGMGTAMMGTGEASGDRRAILAAEEAIANPLLDDVTLKGARGLLLSITGGRDLTLYEVDEAASRVREEVDPDCNIIVGATFDDNLGERVRVSIVASGMRRVGEQPLPQTAAPVTTHAAAPAAHQGGGVGYTPAMSTAPTPPPHMPAASMPSAAPSVGHHGLAPIGMPPLLPASAMTPAHQVHHTAHSSGALPTAPPATPQHATSPEDMHRRLTEAFMVPQGNFQHASPSVPHAVAPAEPAREQWNAGNNVVIEEGFTPFIQPHAPHSQTAPVSAAPESFPTSRGFEPAPPHEIRRQPRRMPTLDELPPQAQKEWHARQAGAANPPPTQSDDGRRKGLFDRLTGLGRRQEGRPQSDPQSDGRQEESRLPVYQARERG